MVAGRKRKKNDVVRKDFFTVLIPCMRDCALREQRSENDKYLHNEARIKLRSEQQEAKHVGEDLNDDTNSDTDTDNFEDYEVSNDDDDAGDEDDESVGTISVDEEDGVQDKDGEDGDQDNDIEDGVQGRGATNNDSERLNRLLNSGKL